MPGSRAAASCAIPTQPRPRPRRSLERRDVAGPRGLGDHPSLDVVGAPTRARRSRRAGAVATSRAPAEHVPARVLLQAAVVAAGRTAGRRHHDDVADLRGHPAASSLHPAVDDDPAADAGPDGPQPPDALSPRPAPKRYSAQATAFASFSTTTGRSSTRPLVEQRFVAPRQVRREHDPRALGVHEPRRRDADRDDVLGGPQLAHRVQTGTERLRRVACGPRAGGRRRGSLCFIQACSGG